MGIRMRWFVPAAALLACAAVADPGHYLYGEILTRDGETVEGPLRWDGEEVYWTDHFNGTKSENPYIKHLSSEDRKYLRTGRPLVVDEWTDAFQVFERISFSDDYESVHAFSVRFGDVDRLVRNEGDSVTVHFRGGETLELDGGSNDIGATVSLLNADGEESEWRWREIKEVRFRAAPAEVSRFFGGTNFGTVTTGAGEFTGIVQWDHDERLSVDVLDGEQDGEDVSLPFERIASIHKDGNASRVTTTDGESFLLTGTNDVDSDNRGIIVDTLDLGRVDIPWKQFASVRFGETSASPARREDFAAPRSLQGSVTTSDGETHTGRLVFDLDEGLDIEFLDGSSDGIDYAIPFRGIARLDHDHVTRLDVTLKNGGKLTLKDADAGVSNDGILVFGESGEPRYLRWENVTTVIFE